MNQPLDLAAIQARHAIATPGPWRTEPHGPLGDDTVIGFNGAIVGAFTFGVGDEADADQDFTLNAPTDITALLAEVRRLRAELDAARAAAFREAARLLEATGRDDDAINLLDNVADGIASYSPSPTPTS